MNDNKPPQSSAVERISSPEKLNEYIRISRISIWIVLGAITALVVAGIYWACTSVVTPEGLRPIDFLIN